MIQKLGLLATALYFTLAPMRAEEAVKEVKEEPKKENVVIPSVKLQQTEIVTDSEIKSRTEIITSKWPLNTDVYANVEFQDAGTFYRFRAQTAPIKVGNFSIGGTGNHIKLPNDTELNDWGPMGRYFRRWKNGFVKHDQRYFVSSNALDGFTILGYRRLKAEALHRYDLDNQSGFFRPGVGVDITKNVNLGLEARFNAKGGKWQEAYTGFRLRVGF